MHGGRTTRRHALPRPLALALSAALILAAACGGATPTKSPSPPPATPTPTPDPRLPDPTSADDVYIALNAAGLGIVGTNAEAGTDPIKQINATYAGQALVIAGYSSDAARRTSVKLTDGSRPGRGDPPYTFSAANIVVQFGPATNGAIPPSPDVAELASAQALAQALDRLMGPLIERSPARVSPTAPPTLSPTLVPSPTSVPSPTPAVSPTPSATT